MIGAGAGAGAGAEVPPLSAGAGVARGRDDGRRADRAPKPSRPLCLG